MPRLLFIIPAALILICSTSMLQAKEGDYCSGEAVMSWDDESKETMSITENGKTEEWLRGTSRGTGMPGTLYSPANGGEELEVLLTTTIMKDANLTPPDEPEIMIFRDRVYWPVTVKA